MGDRKRMPHGVMRRVPESPCENTSWDVRFCDPCSLLIHINRNTGLAAPHITPPVCVDQKSNHRSKV